MALVGRQCQQGKIDPVVVVSQIEDSRKAGAGEFRFIPGAVGVLRVEKV
jgi:hypothetical protein